LAVVLFIVLLIGFILSPRYLVSSGLPIKSDIIIQFPVPEMEEMRRESWQLVKEGYSEYLCIPTSLSLYQANQNGAFLSGIPFPDIEPATKLHQLRSAKGISFTNFKQIRTEYHFPHYYENTHVEMLLAKKVMDAYGFRKALFVSSPYHMKRIRIMAERVFDSTYDITMVPSRFEKKFETPLPSQQDMRHVFTELPKMAWFICYDLWDRWIGVNL
jgi:uncharacterized SAM-binding protein YcdF (DUF218 family)